MLKITLKGVNSGKVYHLNKEQWKYSVRNLKLLHKFFTWSRVLTMLLFQKSSFTFLLKNLVQKVVKGFFKKSSKHPPSERERRSDFSLSKGCAARLEWNLQRAIAMAWCACARWSCRPDSDPTPTPAQRSFTQTRRTHAKALKSLQTTCKSCSNSSRSLSSNFRGIYMCLPWFFKTARW